ncbi:family 10 glycosylhydrolase [Georgenia halophila]|uniref:Family 10 glycosylhydrolase n=1 Tax=Georgenia halophila TaxID=620889 RepID=A0ABP8LMM0_9MICO
MQAEPTLGLDDRRGLRTEEWYRTATRWTQLTLTESDPLHFDPQVWVDIMRENRSNAACLSAGGYMAFYPSQVPFHYRSKYLGDSDPFGALVEGARSLDMHVMARVDSHAIHADALRAHPEWAALDEDGEPYEHWAFPGIWVTCPFGPYNREFITDVARELVRDYDIDAVFANRWQGHGISYSEHARRTFRDDTGLHLPTGPYDADDPAWRAYPGWRRQQLSDLVAFWDTAIRDVRPHARFIPNLGSFAAHELERDLIDKHYPLFFIDRQGRDGIDAPWSAGRNAKRSRGVFRDRPVGLISSVGPENATHRWKDSVTTGAEMKTWIVDGFAQGAFPWFTKFNGTISDNRWIEPVAEAFALHATVEPVLSRLRITADVALLDPTSTGPSHLKQDGERFSHEDGFYHALLEARVPFEFISDKALTAEELARFKVLVLANAERLSEAQCGLIADFVRAGGSLVAAHQTSLLTERGEPRSNFGLSDVLGVDLQEPVRGPVRNNYAELTGEHPVHRGFEGAKRIIGGTQLVGVSAHEDADVPFRFIPDYPDLPMEELYVREPARDPAVVTRQHPGGGRVAYLAFNIGSLFWEALQQDHGRLIGNTVDWALGTEPRVRVDGVGLFDIAVYEGTSEIAVALVNLTNPMTMRGPIRETMPVGPLTVSVTLPPHARPTAATLLVAGQDQPVTVQDGQATSTVPSLELLEVAHLTWDGGTP